MEQPQCMGVSLLPPKGRVAPPPEEVGEPQVRQANGVWEAPLLFIPVQEVELATTSPHLYSPGVPDPPTNQLTRWNNQVHLGMLATHRRVRPPESRTRRSSFSSPFPIRERQLSERVGLGEMVNRSHA